MELRLKTRRVYDWFVLRGRLRRRDFWAKALVSALFFIMLFVLLQRLFGSDGTLVLYPPFFAVWLSLMARRLHDQAKSAWWLFMVLVPVLGPLVMAFLLTLVRGTEGDNQYGADPITAGRDYLKVAVHAAE
jgi:uncharacterized membrane protein YhaH (DUF805 family)